MVLKFIHYKNDKSSFSLTMSFNSQNFHALLNTLKSSNIVLICLVNRNLSGLVKFRVIEEIKIIINTYKLMICKVAEKNTFTIPNNANYTSKGLNI